MMMMNSVLLNNNIATSLRFLYNIEEKEKFI